MTMFCRADLSIGLPRHLVWELLTDPSARQLWQPNVLSAKLVSGYAGGNGSQVTFEVSSGRSTIEVNEHVTRSRVQDSIWMIQSWPKHHIHNKFILTTQQDGCTHLTLQKRYKSQLRFSLLGGSQLTRSQLETAAEQELLGLKNLSAQVQNRMADQSMGLNQRAE